MEQFMGQTLNCQQIETYLRQLAHQCDRTLVLCPRLQVLSQVASTNLTVWELLSQGASEGTVVIAGQQSAGRGQWGREWRSELGGVYLSLALCPKLNSQDAPYLTIASAWGIAHSLQQQGIPVQLKWPNDLVLFGRKLGGILTETRVTQAQIDRAVVGVGLNGFNPTPLSGINLQSFVADLNKANSNDHLLKISESIKLCQDEGKINLEAIAAIVLHGLNLGYSRLQQDGIALILPDYESLLIHMGDAVKLDQQDGTIIGVTAQGKLKVLVECDRGDQIHEVDPGQIQLGYPGNS
jgi:BirA family transcriptional regulator, biotin operon repressor / biotin---[acetyl-CoA-carboxylase] ligase